VKLKGLKFILHLRFATIHLLRWQHLGPCFLALMIVVRLIETAPLLLALPFARYHPRDLNLNLRIILGLILRLSGSRFCSSAASRFALKLLRK
jgi:hypothetical protein